jgi:hypothetical protein
MNRDNIFSIFIFSVIAIVYALPVLKDFSFWGQMDWDQFTFWNAVPRETLLRYHQFPLWNPYANGGNVLLAHPQSSFLSPFFVCVLIFGPVGGLKLQIIIHLILGLWGMYVLGRYLKLSQCASYGTSLIFMLNSMYALHVTEGHADWFVMAFMPYVFLFYLKSIKDPKQIMGAILFLGLILLNGSIDVITVFAAYLAVYALLAAVQNRHAAPLNVLGLLFIGTILLCAVKVIPMLEFLHQYPRITDESDGISLLTLSKMLLSREHAHLDRMDWQITREMGFRYWWHEYGAYSGIIPLLLCLYGAVRSFRKQWPVVMAGISCLFIALGSGSVIPFWKWLHYLPVYNSLTVPTRFILGFVFSCALLAGYGLTNCEEFIVRKWGRKKATLVKIIPVIFVVVIFIDF